jgi:hypothetical protein
MIEEGQRALWPTPEGDVEVKVLKVLKDSKACKEIAEVQWPDIFSKGSYLKAKIEVKELKELT